MRRLWPILISATLILSLTALAGDGVRKAYADGTAVSAGTLHASMPGTDDQWSRTFQGYATPGYIQKTCGGNMPSGEDKYYFGFKRSWDNMCMTRMFVANDSTEASKCAHDSCQTCDTVEDLTGEMSDYHNKPGAFDGQVMLKYCPARE